MDPTPLATALGRVWAMCYRAVQNESLDTDQAEKLQGAMAELEAHWPIDDEGRSCLEFLLQELRASGLFVEPFQTPASIGTILNACHALRRTLLASGS